MKKIFTLLKLILIYGFVNAQCVTPPPATLTVIKTLVCRDEGVIITASVQGVAHYYEWYKNNVLVHSGYGSYNIYQSVTEPGPYKVRYYTDPNAGCYSPFSNEITFQIQEYPVVQVAPQNNSKICSGGTANFSLSSSNVPDATIIWTVDPGAYISGASSGSGNNISQTLTTANTSSVSHLTYTVRALKNDCYGPAIPVTVDVVPPPTIQASSPTTVCQGGLVQLTATPSGVNHSFDRDGAVINSSASSISVGQSGNYTYSISVPGYPGCVQTSQSVTVNVLPTPAPVVSTPTSTTFCPGQSVSLTATSPPTNSDFSYWWLKNGQTVGGAQSFTANTPGTYSVRVDNRDCNLQGNYFAWTSVVLTENNVNAGIISNYAGNLNNPAQMVCQGGDPSAFAELMMGSGAGTTNYQWKVSYDGVTYTSVPNATGATYDVPPGIITQTSSYIRVTSSTLNNVTCYGNSNPVDIIIKPTPSFTPGVIAPVCSGSTNQVFLPYTNLSGGAFYYRIDWTTLTDIPWSPLPANQIPISIPSQPGNYSAGVYLRNTSSCESLMYPITVVVYPKPSMTTSNKVICSGQSTDLYLSSDVAGATFSWTVLSKSATISGVLVGTTGTGNVISNTLTNSSFSSDGSVVYRITPTANGCTGVSADVTVKINAKVSGGVLNGNQSICTNGNPVVFSESSGPQGPGIPTYKWYSSLDNVSYSEISSIQFYDPPITAQTTYYKRLTTYVQNSNPCSVYNSTPLVITVVPLNPGSINNGSQWVCENGNPVAFQQTPASGLGTLSYLWQKSFMPGSGYSNTGVISADYDPEPLTRSTYFKRIVTSTACTASAETNYFYVYVDSINASVSPASATICQGQTSVALNAIPRTTASYEWKRGTTVVATGPSSNYAANQAGTYTVKIVSTNGCWKVSSSIPVDQSTGVGLIRQFYDLCVDGYADLRAPLGASNILWSTNQNLQTIRVYDPGTYTVSYTSSGGCSEIASILVQRVGSPCIMARRSNTHTEEPNPESQKISFYPNPANSILNIELPAAAAKPTPVVLIDAFGKTVYQSEFRMGEKTKTVSTEAMADGIYMLQLTTPGGSKAVRKVMVKH